MAAALTSCGGGGGGDAPPPAPTFALTGAIRAPEGTAIDGDVNDPSAPLVPNDSPAQAQRIPNPVTVGGYANLPGQGQSGRSSVLGDTADYYRVQMGAGQTVSLFLAEAVPANDLDLFLLQEDGTPALDGNGEPIASMGDTPFEALTVPDAGTYLLLVEAQAGASNYVLVVGQGGASAGAQPEYVPGEFVVRFREEGVAAGVGPSRRAARLGMTTGGGEAGRAVLLRMGEAGRRPTQRAALGLSGSALQSEDPAVQRRLETRRMVKALRGRPDILSADLNYIRRPSLAPDDPFFPLQWHYPLINLPQAWDSVPDASNVLVAVLDTGVLLEQGPGLPGHPDLLGQFAQDGDGNLVGFDFISSAASANDGDGIDPNPNDPGDGATEGSSSFHGTHVAGTVAAAVGNGEGVAGVARNAKIMPLRVLGVNGGTDFDIIQAVRYAAGLPNDSGTSPPQPADVVNMSFGGPGFSSAAQNAMNEARGAGVLLVAAAGNGASTTPFYPAAYSAVVAVSAVDIRKDLAPYSNFGSWIDVAAPGGNGLADVNGDGHPDGVLSTGATDHTSPIRPVYLFLQGTSMAAPHVSGVFALMKSVNGDLAPDDFLTADRAGGLLAAGLLTEDLGPPGRDDRFGNGLIDAFRAISAALEQGGAAPPTQPTLVVSPSALNLGLAATAATLIARNGGGGTLTVGIPSADVPWLTVGSPSVDAEGVRSYPVAASRAGLNPGTFTATITFPSSANTVRVPVIMQVIDPNAAAGLVGNAGFHYVLLVEAATGVPVAQETVEADAGTYAFRFDGVPAGAYIIVAGTDSDNDRVICDPGEACGAFRTLDQPEAITVGADLGGLDFATGFASGLLGATGVGGDVAPIPRLGLPLRNPGGP